MSEKEIGSLGKSKYVCNENLKDLPEDFLYHIDIGTATHNIKELFHDVKFVCIGGSPSRMHKLAVYFSTELSQYMPADLKLENLTGSSDRYVIYKVGPILTASHGIGVPSMSVLMNELFKLLHYAAADDVTFLRLGTSGGLGIEPGSVVVTTEALNGLMEPYFEQDILGRRVKRECSFNSTVVNGISDCSSTFKDFQVVLGKTMCANDFYEGQGRLDGAICDFTLDDKMKFIHTLHDRGVKNIEMECTAFAALTKLVNVKSAVVCVTLLNRLNGDQVLTEKSTLKSWELRPAQVVAEYMKRQLSS